jgi:heterodisulfide reductase subunit D
MASQGGLAVSQVFENRIFSCTLCAACDQVCPSGVGVEQILLGAREEIALQDQLSPNLARLSRTVRERHNISGEDNDLRLSWAENLERQPLGSARQKADAVYFVGCVSSLFPRSYAIPRAFVQTLEAADADYALLGGSEWCCGYPLLANGLLSEAQETILHNVARVRATGAQQVLFACPSCYHMWKHVYPEIARDTMEDLETLHASEYLANLVDQGRLAFAETNLTVAYHDPCDLGRKSGVYEAPRRVLQGIPGLTLVEMADNREEALCCGGGGNLESYDPGLVASISSRRLAQAQAAGAQAIVSACQQCERTLAAAARRERVRIRVLDIAEIVWNALEPRRPTQEGTGETRPRDV